MALPQAVQQQIDEAEALQQQLYTESPADPAEAQTVSEVVEAEPASAQVIDLKPQADPAPPVETPSTSDEAAVWKHKFESLRGKFDAEVPRLYQQLKEQNDQMQQLMRQLQEKPEPVKEAPEPQSQQDSDDFGNDLVDMVDRRAAVLIRREIAAAMAEFRKDLGQVNDRVGHVVEKVVESEADKFWNSVIAKVPDWIEIDADPRWFAFLDTSPDFSEDSYRDLASKAIAKGNPDKIAKLVETFKATLPRQPEPAAAKPQADLSRQVTPATTKSSVSSTPTAERIWSKEDYEQAYDVRNTTRYGAAKAAEMQAEADRAFAEGRVRW